MLSVLIERNTRKDLLTFNFNFNFNFFYRSTVHFDNVKILSTNKCTFYQLLFTIIILLLLLIKVALVKRILKIY